MANFDAAYRLRGKTNDGAAQRCEPPKLDLALLQQVQEKTTEEDWQVDGIETAGKGMHAKQKQEQAKQEQEVQRSLHLYPKHHNLQGEGLNTHFKDTVLSIVLQSYQLHSCDSNFSFRIMDQHIFNCLTSNSLQLPILMHHQGHHSLQQVCGVVEVMQCRQQSAHAAGCDAYLR